MVGIEQQCCSRQAIDSQGCKEIERERPSISPNAGQVQGRPSQVSEGATGFLLLQRIPTSQAVKMSLLCTSIHVFHVTYSRVQESSSSGFGVIP